MSPRPSAARSEGGRAQHCLPISKQLHIRASVVGRRVLWRALRIASKKAAASMYCLGLVYMASTYIERFDEFGLNHGDSTFSTVID